MICSYYNSKIILISLGQKVPERAPSQIKDWKVNYLHSGWSIYSNKEAQNVVFINYQGKDIIYCLKTYNKYRILNQFKYFFLKQHLIELINNIEQV